MKRFFAGVMVAAATSGIVGAQTYDGHVNVGDPPRYILYQPVYSSAPDDQPTYYSPYHAVHVVPAYSQPADNPPAPTRPAGNYGDRLSSLNDKLYRHRQLLENQAKKGVITLQQRDHYLDILQGIEHDEHEESYDNNGFISAEDLADLNRRADQAGEDIETFLAAE